MKEIKEIVKFLSKKKLRHIETFNLDDNTTSVYRKMYYEILNNETITEDELADKIAGTKKSDKKYGMIKSRFKRRLFNHILFLDLAENATEVNKIISAAYKQIYVAKLLQINNLLDASHYMVKKAMPILLKQELLEPLLTAYQIKINHHSRKGQSTKVERLSEELINISKALMLQNQVFTLYEKAGLLYSKAERLNYRDANKMAEIITSLNRVIEIDNIQFKAKWTALVIINEYAVYQGDYSKFRGTLSKIKKLLKDNPHFNYKVRKLLVLTWELTLKANLNEIAEGLLLIKKIRDLYDENNLNWFFGERKILFYYISITSYSEAHSTSINVLGNNNFKLLNNKTQEMWVLWHTYLSIIKAEYDTKKLKEINLLKVLNSVSKISQDKTGLNTLVRNLEILYKYLIDDKESLIEMPNSLTIYKSRYLKPNKLRRAQIFTDFIIKSGKEGFLKGPLKINGAKAIKKLENLKNDNPEKKAFEFIPYEKLIEIMVNK